MVKRGARPKPAHLRLVDATHRKTRHGDEAKSEAKVSAALAAFGKLQRPKGLKGGALAAWKNYIEPAGWLDGSKEPAAIAFCELWSEFRSAPMRFPAAKHSQLRAYMNELGLTDERNRPGEKEEKDPFFDDASA